MIKGCFLCMLLMLMPSLVISSNKRSCLFAGTDLSPIMPVLAKVFDQALAGGALILLFCPSALHA